MPSQSTAPDERRDRLEKLAKIKKWGVNPYPARCKRTHANQEVILNFDKLSNQQKKVTVVGRIRAIRKHGGSCFLVIEDESNRLQIYCKKDDLGDRKYNFIKDLIDIGDFVEATGTLFITKSKEKTLLVDNFELLSKALLPLPEKWHGLSDMEIRFRKRYLDLIANPEVKGIFKKRSLIIQTIRNFLLDRKFLEVDTPILQSLAGGATAKPFITKHNALKADFYLRIAPELYLKRLIVGGLEKVFEISRCFRNEGIDVMHNPEFTQVEFYEAYADYNDHMQLIEELLPHIANKIGEGLTLKYNNQKIDLAPPYPRLTFRDALKKYAKLDIASYQKEGDLARKAKSLGLNIDKSFGKGKILDELYKKFVRPNLVQPTFLINHPIELSPLSKKVIAEPDYVERFQLIAGGTELCNAFSELNDPVDQAERFKEQQKLKKAGDEEAQPADKDFVEAVEQGLPPCAGLGLGIDRLVMLLTDTHNIREVILFPTLKQKQRTTNNEQKSFN